MELVVLKGIKHHNRIIDFSNLKLFENKFQYFLALQNANESIVTYEEFLLFKDFFQNQYSKIIFRTDNRFIYHYPVIYKFDENALNQLCKFYSDETEDDEIILDKSAEFYKTFLSDVIKIDDRFYVTYVDDNIISSNNEYVFQFLITEKIAIITEDIDQTNVFEIIDEVDYIRLLKKLDAKTVNDIYININGSDFSRDLLLEKLSLLKYEFKDFCDLHVVNRSLHKTTEFENAEYVETLKRYWNRNKFLNFNIYNLEKLDDGYIETFSIAQDQIINDLMIQIEQCRKGDYFRDLFVTAPTGSGKSAIFQIPAIIIAERYNLMTLVVSPLIGLMSDQIDNLEIKGYKYARTINSDISPIIKTEIMTEIQNNKCHILYLSPESLMGKSDLESLIGNRTVGMIVIDESHIVTTWGKQFRPDYWYLGDHIQSLRKKQLEKKQQSFVVSTFTATAIYRGMEDMYGETKSSLQMINPITYLGEVKRTNIQIDVSEVTKVTNKQEYEENKFKDIVEIIKKSLLYGRKTLVYFPTKPLISRFYDRCSIEKLSQFVTSYYGGMDKTIKMENMKSFKNGTKMVMLATKAFGMGIDIDNIADVIHFAPTGNVCDYVQEIGRAARKRDIEGKAIYHFMNNDFKHINRLHGMSTVTNLQLVQVMGKILELFDNQIKNSNHLKKQNSILIDSENFSYIFEKTNQDEEDSINKVKTALLLIQKDFQYTRGYTPFRAKPIPLFSIGFFHIQDIYLKEAKQKFKNYINLIPNSNNIYRIDLKNVWENSKELQIFSFPQFKYLLYTKDKQLSEFNRLNLNSALEFTIIFKNDSESIFSNIFNNLQKIISKAILENKYYSPNQLSIELSESSKISIFHSRNIIDIFLSSLARYKEYVNNNIHQKLVLIRSDDLDLKYNFTNSMDDYFKWLNKEYKYFKSESKSEGIYLINSSSSNLKGKVLALGLLESFGVLSFKALGGANSQLYIYINQTQSMYNIINKPYSYENRILKKVNDRHKMSVKMLTYLFSNNFDSETIWNKIEEYFLGKIPEQVVIEFEKV